MFGRQITAKLKATSVTEFMRINEEEILPILRKQKGFRDGITLVSPERLEVVASTFWDSQADADAYSRAVYPDVMKIIANVIEGSPSVKTFEFATSTFNKAVAAKLA